MYKIGALDVAFDEDMRKGNELHVNLCRDLIRNKCIKVDNYEERLQQIVEHCEKAEQSQCRKIAIIDQLIQEVQIYAKTISPHVTRAFCSLESRRGANPINVVRKLLSRYSDAVVFNQLNWSGLPCQKSPEELLKQADISNRQIHGIMRGASETFRRRKACARVLLNSDLISSQTNRVRRLMKEMTSQSSSEGNVPPKRLHAAIQSGVLYGAGSKPRPLSSNSREYQPPMALYRQQQQGQPHIPTASLAAAPLRMPSQFLQRRLSRGCRYFDSGDYNVAKAELKRLAEIRGIRPSLLDARQYTGNQMARPETVFGRDLSCDQEESVSSAAAQNTSSSSSSGDQP
ncbi:hypothetical protein ACOME3_009420 [Neoechinorhynchus agilis]